MLSHRRLAERKKPNFFHHKTVTRQNEKCAKLNNIYKRELRALLTRMLYSGLQDYTITLKLADKNTQVQRGLLLSEFYLHYKANK